MTARPMNIDLWRAWALVLAVLILIAWALSGCTSAQIATVGADIATGIAAACQDVSNAAKINPASPVVVYANAACPQGVAAGELVQNSATLQWLGKIQGQLSAGS